MRNVWFIAFVIFLLLTTFLPSSSTWNTTKSSLLHQQRRHKRIIGGKISENHKWTFVAMVESRDKNEQWNECSATIISSRHILTAAHCIVGLNYLEYKELYVVLKKEGYHLRINKLGINDIETFPRVEIHRVYAHLHFNVQGNDIAILEANETLFADMKHIKLANNFEDDSQKSVMVMGFGDYDVNGNYNNLKPSTKLREIETFTHTFEECQNIWEFPLDHDTHICVGEGRNGIATGDSGGPMLAQAINGEYYQIGVASYGGKRNTTYETRPSIFMKLNKFCPWIETITKQMVKCHKAEFTASFLIDDYQIQPILSTSRPSSSPFSTRMIRLPMMLSITYFLLFL